MAIFTPFKKYVQVKGGVIKVITNFNYTLNHPDVITAF